jgi:hypothetical protein
MRTAILNVSLDAKIAPGQSIEQRHRMVMACMRLLFQGACIGEIGAAQYDGPDGAVQERCSIITVDLHGVSLHVFEDGIHHVSRSLGQDCIAVMYDDGTGKCIGPNAERWPFDRKFFNLPAVCQLALEAA